MRNLEVQIGSIVIANNGRQQGTFPSSTEVNSKRQCNAITLWSEKKLPKAPPTHTKIYERMSYPQRLKGWSLSTLLPKWNKKRLCHKLKKLPVKKKRTKSLIRSDLKATSLTSNFPSLLMCLTNSISTYRLPSIGTNVKVCKIYEGDLEPQEEDSELWTRHFN